MTKTGLNYKIIALPYMVSTHTYRRPPRKARYAAAFLLLAACCLIPLACSHPVHTIVEDEDEDESTVTITLPGAIQLDARAAVTDAAIAQMEFELTLTKGPDVKTVTAPPGKSTVTVNLAEGEWRIAAEAYLPDDHVPVGTGSTRVKVGPGQPNKVIITIVFDNTLPGAVTTD
ncbi:MAG: hypothetical protein LBK62_07800 [Treponema sp.]|jgi:multidrug efflux pump subunit AcrB|nr:hypothetical protein [Treponema sp.]